MLGFGARDQHARIDEKLATIKTGAADEVRKRFAGPASSRECAHAVGIRIVYRFIVMRAEPCAIAIDHVRNKSVTLGRVQHRKTL
jgi:hypothetical protein